MQTDFVEATTRYETWLGSLVEIVKSDLKYKHKEMASLKSAFPFFRGTYYRWAEIWPLVCEHCQSAPTVLSIGDLHVENFGTWRDREGRLVWGINDFDEAEDLPFTNDLVRLAASAELGANEGQFELSFKGICRAILSGYVSQLESKKAMPFVLEEDHLELRALAMQGDREPVKFWKDFDKKLSDNLPDDFEPIKAVLLKDLPGTDDTCKFHSRIKAGMGSLGKPRFVALATFTGSKVAREAKALTPASTACFDPGRHRSRIKDVLASAVRCADPIYRVDGDWIVRRLSPRCSRIEIDQLDCGSEKQMFSSMGAEGANIHLGTAATSEPILKWLEAQDSNWLSDAASAMVEATREDWRAWRRHYKATHRNKKSAKSGK